MAVRIISFSHSKELFCLLLFYFRCVPYRYKLYNKIKMHFYHQVAYKETKTNIKIAWHAQTMWNNFPEYNQVL